MVVSSFGSAEDGGGGGGCVTCRLSEVCKNESRLFAVVPSVAFFSLLPKSLPMKRPRLDKRPSSICIDGGSFSMVVVTPKRHGLSPIKLDKAGFPDARARECM